MRWKSATVALALFAAVWVVSVLFSATGVAAWERAVFGAPLVTALVGFFVLPLCAIAAAGLSLTDAGVNARQPARWLEIGCTAMAVFGILTGVAFAISGDPRATPGAWYVTLACAASLPIIGLVLRKPRAVDAAAAPATVWVVLALAALLLIVAWATRGIAPVIPTVLDLLFFTGVGEELLFRGAIQGLLDRTFGTPWRVFGAELGWGWLIQALLFGLIHPLVAGDVTLWPWGIWTAVAGLSFGWLRARSGTIFAPALVHGVTDTIGLALVPLLLPH